MIRSPSPRRSTPHIDRWKRKLAHELTDRGARTRLAEWLEQQYGSTVERWKVQIAKILNTPQIPDGEFVLAVDRYFATKQKNGR
jgi:hypothetical protein